MIDKIRTLFFEPRYPHRYVGRHRARPFLSVAARR